MLRERLSSIAATVRRARVVLFVACAAYAASAAACSLGDAVAAPTTNTLAAAPLPSASSAINPLNGAKLWVNATSNARATADAWRATRPADAAAMDKVASGAQATWFGNWNVDVRSDVDAAVTQMASDGATPVIVAYNIPQRDCGGASGGNATTSDAYRAWIAAFADGIGQRKVAVVLEPDALAEMDCLNAADQQTRLALLAFATQALRATGNVSVYIDAGHPGWQSAATMASRLVSAGIALAQGFSLNVANFVSTSDNVAYGAQISALTGRKHFVIDTGRNGLGPTSNAQWCNPPGRGLGTPPSTSTGIAGVDAYLWIKTPGESDGPCNGAPAARVWYPDYALGLGQRAAF